MSNFHYYSNTVETAPCNDYRIVLLWLNNNNKIYNNKKEDDIPTEDINSRKQKKQICIECKCYYNNKKTTTQSWLFSSSSSALPLYQYGDTPTRTTTLPLTTLRNIILSSSSSSSYILQPLQQQQQRQQDTEKEHQYPIIVSTLDQQNFFLLISVSSNDECGYFYILYPIVNQSLRKQLLSLLPQKPPPSLQEKSKKVSTHSQAQPHLIVPPSVSNKDWKSLFDDGEDHQETNQPTISSNRTPSQTTIVTTPNPTRTSLSPSTKTPTHQEENISLQQYCNQWINNHDDFFSVGHQIYVLDQLFKVLEQQQQRHRHSSSIAVTTATTDYNDDIMYINQSTLHHYCYQTKNEQEQQHPNLLQILSIQIMIRLQIVHFYGFAKIPNYYVQDWKNAGSTQTKKKKKKKNKQTKKLAEDPKIIIKNAVLDLFSYVPFLLDPKERSLMEFVKWILKPFFASSSVSWICVELFTYFEFDLPSDGEDKEEEPRMNISTKPHHSSQTHEIDSQPNATAKITVTTASNPLAQPSATKLQKTTITNSTTNKSDLRTEPFTATATSAWKKTSKSVPNHFCTTSRPIIHVPRVPNYPVTTRITLSKSERELTKASEPRPTSLFCSSPQQEEITPLKKGGRLASTWVADAAAAAAAARTKMTRRSA